MCEAPETVPDAGATDSTRRESLLYFPGTLVRALMGALTLPILSIFFEPADIGRYDLTGRFVDLLYTLCGYWLGTVIIRYYSTFVQRRETAVYLNVVGLVQVGGILTGLVLLGVTRCFAPVEYRGLLAIAAVMFIGYSIFQTGLMMLRAKSNAGAFSGSLIIASVGRLPLGLLLAIPLGLGVGGMLWAAAIAYLALYLIFMRRHFAPLRVRLTPAERAFLRETLAYGLPLGIGAVMVFLLGNADRYLLQHLRSDAEVGLFAVGSQFGEQPIFVLYSTLMLAAFPATARVFDRDGRRAAEGFVGALTRTYLLVAAPVTILLIVLAGPFLGMFPKEYPLAATVMPWIAMGTFLQGLSQYPALGLFVTKHTRLVFAINGAGVLVNVAVNAVLIPALGFVGCGITRVIANFAVLLLTMALTYRHLCWRVPLLTVFRVGLATLLTGGAVYWAYGLLPASLSIPVTLCALTVASCGGLLAFVILLLLFREVRLKEVIDKLQMIVRRNGLPNP